MYNLYSIRTYIRTYICVYFISEGAVIEGPRDIIYFPNQGPVELTCNISEGSTGWQLNNDRIYTLTEIRRGELTGHSLNGANLVVNVPTNNTEYTCVSIRDAGNIISDPAFLYIAGRFIICVIRTYI